jgi:hypothetical protein
MLRCRANRKPPGSDATLDEPSKSLHISGRLVFPDGSPVSFNVRLLRIDSDGPKDDLTAVTGPDGRFTFAATPGHRYKIALAAGGMKTGPKTADTTSAKVSIGSFGYRQQCNKARYFVHLTTPLAPLEKDNLITFEALQPLQPTINWHVGHLERGGTFPSGRKMPTARK